MMLATETTTPKPFVFVLMPFDSAFDDIYKFGIKGAADDVGAYAERVDEQTFGEGMLDRIFNQISKADVIVADMTGRNPNVFYEVGYAHALGKVVLLLTQKTDDIPFDLKHRQHTVYGGKIDILRRDLAVKLQWAIAESGRRKTATPELFTVRIQDLLCVEGMEPADMPTLDGVILDDFFWLPVQIRNHAIDVMTGITHVYLFSSPEAVMVPCEVRNEYSARTTARAGERQVLASVPTQRPQELFPMVADPVDAPDGLTSQFRVPMRFDPIPPAASEQQGFHLMLRSGAKEAEATYRLRLHSATRYYDYMFGLKIKVDPDFKPESDKK